MASISSSVSSIGVAFAILVSPMIAVTSARAELSTPGYCVFDSGLELDLDIFLSLDIAGIWLEGRGTGDAIATEIHDILANSVFINDAADLVLIANLEENEALFVLAGEAHKGSCRGGSGPQ